MKAAEAAKLVQHLPHLSARERRALSELSEGLRARYGRRLRQLYLFGSRARGEAKPDSDLDLLVVLEGLKSPAAEIPRLSEITYPIGLRYDLLIAPVILGHEEIDPDNLPSVLKRALKEGFAL